MRVCLHTIWPVVNPPLGGTERFLVDFAKELTALGYEAFICCTGPDGFATVEGVDVIYRLPASFKKGFQAAQGNVVKMVRSIVQDSSNVEDALRKLGNLVECQVADMKYDVLHLNSFVSAAYSTSIRPIVVTNHENPKEYEHYWGDQLIPEMAHLVRSGRTQLNRAFRLAVPSRHYADDYSAMFQLHVESIPLGISLGRFPAFSSRDKIQEPAGPKTILVPSRLEPHQKGQDIAIRACGILARQGEDVRVVLSGVRDDNKHHVAPMRKLAHAESLHDRLVIRRFQDILEGYRSCHVVVSPERYCSYGLSISEALALGTPTVLSRIPTYLEIAAKVPHAFFFNPDDVEDLAEQLRKALACDSSQRSRNAIQFRRANDLRRCAIEYGTRYEMAMDNRSAP